MVVKVMKELDEIFEKIDFNGLWNGFEMSKYAIYDEEHFYINDNTGLDLNLVKKDSCLVGKRDERFIGNTAISINDDYVAIVGINGMGDNAKITKWASLFTHEMFHCFQYSKGKKKFPNELLSINYPITNENIYYRTQERKYLLDACIEKNKNKKLELLALYFNIRNKREKLLDNIIDYEKALESTEGTAVYVEYKSLTQMIPNNEALILDEYIKGFTDINEWNLQIRHSTYNQGLLLGLIADKLIPNWKIEFDDSELYLSDFIKKELKIDDLDMDCEYRHIPEIEQCVTKRNKQIDGVFDDFYMKSKGNVIEEDVQVTGFDPMNIVKRDHEIIHKNFLRIKVGEDVQLIKGPVKTIIGEHLFEIKRVEW